MSLRVKSENEAAYFYSAFHLNHRASLPIVTTVTPGAGEGARSLRTLKDQKSQHKPPPNWWVWLAVQDGVMARVRSK